MIVSRHRLLGPCLAVGLSLLGGCRSGSKSTTRCGQTVPPAAGHGVAAALVSGLGLGGDLALGVGNDLVGDGTEAHAWTLHPPPPVHYLYLVGLPGRGGWPEWNSEGGFIDRHAEAAQERCVVPAFTLYAMTVEGEGDPATAASHDYMAAWWAGYELALARLAAFGEPALLHVEPDFWGFMQKATGRMPDQIAVSVGAHVPQCADLPDTLAGFGTCLVRRSRTVAPRVRLGFHASLWAHPDPSEVARFLLAAGVADTDALFVETLDRDAGCFEAGGPGCQREDGPWYWDASNTRSPNFREHLTATGALHRATGLPLVWWQTPLGVPDDAPGGRTGRYRDNRVAYVFDHPEEFVAAGGAAVLFGAGWTGQTDLTTDQGQFADRWADHQERTVPLP